MMLESWNQRRETALRRVSRFGAPKSHRALGQEELPEGPEPRVSFGGRSRHRHAGAQAQARFWMMVAVLIGVLIYIF